MLVTDRVELSPPARDFLQDSIRRDRNVRRRAVTVLSVLLVLALIGAGIALDQRGTAPENQRTATARQLLTQADSLLGSDPRPPSNSVSPPTTSIPTRKPAMA